ncbi:MAG: flagellar biosynthesis protein FlhB [Deltaproteobacteria bacterium]|nr:flagellar biosynthesis protein FlhB [Deltaproteobacteria bacterium]
MAEDLASKTEEPTPRRVEKAREEGQLARSLEVTSATVLLTAVFAISQSGSETSRDLREAMRGGLERLTATDLTPGAVGNVLWDAGGVVVAAALPVILAIALAGTVSNLAQIGFGFYPTLLLPKGARISPASGMRRIFSRRGAVELLKNIVKITLVSWVAWKVVLSTQQQLPAIGLATPAEIMATGGRELARMLTWVAATLAVLATLDYLWQRRSHQQSLRMTKQEVKDEARQSEGDPKLRQRMRRAYRDLSGNRMLNEVATADVVVTNPTHYAVALRYRSDEHGAPRVVAKGVDEVAQRIKQEARRHGVPIIERRALARALYRSVKTGSEIPAALYRAVAEVLAYIYGLQQRRVS